MFSVLFEVNPRGDQWETYLDRAKLLRPELEQVDGFVDNIRYRSLTRPGWILSISSWRDEKALVRWRTKANHHEVQAQGREEILLDYRLRVGQITTDTHLPAGQELREQRLDITDNGPSTVVLTSGRRPVDTVTEANAFGVATWLGFDAQAPNLSWWDVFDAVLQPGDVILMSSWTDEASAAAFAHAVQGAGGEVDAIRSRQVRVIRDYGLTDRYEAPQYYPAPGSAAVET